MRERIEIPASSLRKRASVSSHHIARLIHRREMAARTATIERKTNETQISVSINLDCQPGTGNKQEIDISTGIGFLDHVRSLTSCSYRT